MPETSDRGPFPTTPDAKTTRPRAAVVPGPSIPAEAPGVNVTTTRMKYGRCPFCGRQCALTFHHLIPRKLHRRVYFKKTFSREELRHAIRLIMMWWVLPKAMMSSGRNSPDR